MKKLIYSLVILGSIPLLAMGNEQRITALEKQINSIIKNEKERTEAINKLATAVLELEKKMLSEKKSPTITQMEESDQE